MSTAEAWGMSPDIPSPGGPEAKLSANGSLHSVISSNPDVVAASLPEDRVVAMITRGPS